MLTPPLVDADLIDYLPDALAAAVARAEAAEATIARVRKVVEESGELCDGHRMDCVHAERVAFALGLEYPLHPRTGVS